MTIDLGLSAAASSAVAASSSSGGPGQRVPSPWTALPPGFRFHPTDEELILHYLRKRAAAAPCPAPVIAEVDIYKFDPWQLPAKAVFGEAEWYFFSPRDRKYPNGVRPNRAAGSGYWKATGTDKPITLSSSGSESSNSSSSRGATMIGVKKALVFYKGRPPKGMKTSWIMHEYRLAEALNAVNTYRPVRFIKNASMRLDDYVLCRIYKKTTPQLAYSMSPPHELEEGSSMDAGGSGGGGAGFDLGLQLLDDSDDIMAGTSSYASRLPRPASISDYLADYSAVSELFDTLPPPPPPLPETTTTTAQPVADAATRFFFGNSSEPAAASTSVPQHQQMQSPLKRRTMDEDYSNSGGMNASSSKRVMMSDHHAASSSSMAVNNAFSMFEPAGQTSLQDRI